MLRMFSLSDEDCSLLFWVLGAAFTDARKAQEDGTLMFGRNLPEKIHALFQKILGSEDAMLVPARPDCLKEWKAALEWYAGSHRPEDYIEDNGQRAVNALKWPVV